MEKKTKQGLKNQEKTQKRKNVNYEGEKWQREHEKWGIKAKMEN